MKLSSLILILILFLSRNALGVQPYDTVTFDATHTTAKFIYRNLATNQVWNKDTAAWETYSTSNYSHYLNSAIALGASGSSIYQFYLQRPAGVTVPAKVQAIATVDGTLANDLVWGTSEDSIGSGSRDSATGILAGNLVQTQGVPTQGTPGYVGADLSHRADDVTDIYDVSAPMPICTSIQFKPNVIRRINYRLSQCPIARSTTLYFSFSSGNDSTGDGSVGNPYKTSAKAQTLVDASIGNVAIMLKRGDTWRQTSTWLKTNKPNITLGAYGAGAKPLITSFTVQYPNGTTWTAQGGGNANVYKRTEAADVAWVREVDDIINIYTRCTSIAEVNSTETSFWYDNATTTLYIHRRQSGSATVDPTNDGRDYEVVASTTGTTAGTTVEGVNLGGNGSRIDNIRFDGFGISRTDGHTSSYGIILSVSTTGVAAVTNCEAYFSTDHLMGHLSSTSGGITVWANNRYGYCCPVNASTIAFVAYAATGGHEVLCYGMECLAADLPYTANTGSTATPCGIPGYCHTGSGSVALAIAMNCRVIAGPYQARGVWHWGNAPAVGSTLTNAKCFIVDYIHPADVYGNIIDTFSYADNVLINPYMEIRWNLPTYANWTDGQEVAVASSNPSFAPSGVIVNGRIIFSAPNLIVPGNDVRNFCVNAGNGSTVKIFGSRLEWRVTGDGTTTVWCNDLKVNNNLANVSDVILAGSMWIVKRQAFIATYGGHYLGIDNASDHLIGNYYFGLGGGSNYGADVASGYRGYDQDATGILGSEYLIDAPPRSDTTNLTTSPIMVMGYPLQYDAKWLPRNYATAIGPFERQQTNADLVAAISTTNDNAAVAAANIGNSGAGLTALPALVWANSTRSLTDKANFTLTVTPPTAAQVATQITTDHGSGSYVRNTEPDNANIAVAAAQASNANANAVAAAGFASTAAGVVTDGAFGNSALKSTLGTAGAGLTALGDTRIAHLNADVTSRMATFTLPANFSALVISGAGAVTAGTLPNPAPAGYGGSPTDLTGVTSMLNTITTKVNQMLTLQQSGHR